ncbi:MAG: hypothetical protein F6K39_03625 [Okeania sp. SIO3B3]|nr:hypothetical protein [Okeania sp. SIO3B3]
MRVSIISCPFEYLHFGGRKAAMLRELKAEGKERFKGRRFFITNYPDMI